MKRFRRIGITVKSDMEERDAVLSSVLDVLEQEKCEVCIDEKRCQDLPSARGISMFACEEDFDLLLVVGGDGTILRAIRELKDFSIPILSINRGAVGFLAELTEEEVPHLLAPFLRGEGVLDERRMLYVQAFRDTQEVVSGYVLNEAVIAQGSIARLVELHATINGENLTTFRADGLILSTPTGSTAYSLAAGGPIVHPSLQATILTPINSHSFSQKPIVIPEHQTVEVEVLPRMNKFGDIEVSLTLDGQIYTKLQRNDRVRASVNGRTVKFLRRKQDTFYGTIRTKLGWGETLRD